MKLDVVCKKLHKVTNVLHRRLCYSPMKVIDVTSWCELHRVRDSIVLQNVNKYRVLESSNQDKAPGVHN
jgi:hypothetical protein